MSNEDSSKPKRKVGRPPADIDHDQVVKLAAMGCPMEEIATWFNISRMTLHNHARRDPLVREALDRGNAFARIKIRRILDKLAETHVAAAIFLAKNLLGYSDSGPTQMVDPDLEYLKKLTPTERRARIEELYSRIKASKRDNDAAP